MTFSYFSLQAHGFFGDRRFSLEKNLPQAALMPGSDVWDSVPGFSYFLWHFFETFSKVR